MQLIHNKSYCYLFVIKYSVKYCQIRYNHDLRKFLSEFPKKHSNECETFWSQFWRNRQQSMPSNASSEAQYSLLLPPPNITGSLHLGHALTVSIQDAICRYNRMNGKSVVWIPGLDHAGIATQLIVEKYLRAKHGKTKSDLTRQQFLSEVNEWAKTKSSEIREQLIKLGVCLDFDREFYTLSKSMSETVNEAFIKLFNDKFIYRDSLMINWSFYLQSSISDIEVKHEEIKGRTLLTVPGFDDKVLVGVMHRIKYPVYGHNEVKHLTVATSRVETIIGDVAVAVHPDDTRYSHLIGLNVINPLTNEKLPIIGDHSVKPDFGSGVLKITSGHSFVDYDIAKRHSLPIIDIFDSFGKLKCPQTPELHEVHRFAAKKIVIEILNNKGLYCDESDQNQYIPLCFRSGDIIESRIVPQWFFKCDELSMLADYVVNKDYKSEKQKLKCDCLASNLKEEDRYLTLIPPNYRNVWKEWFSRPQDWCISRQILWGHQIPAYNVIIDGKSTDNWVAANSKSEALALAASNNPSINISSIDVQRDNDVLDTWFSSALLPLVIAGWPLQEPLKPFPLSLMETGFDIIFFWVARMVMMSLALVGKLPFKEVLLHGMICDTNNKKMSKSKGNVIDPIDVIEGISLEKLRMKNINYYESGILSKQQLETSLVDLDKKFPKGIPDCGADSLRLTLLQLDFKESRANFNTKYVISNRLFCNKMHQSVNFCLAFINNRFKQTDISSIVNELSSIDRWILQNLVSTIKTCNKSFLSYDLQYATHRLQRFWLNQLCDVYIEAVKPLLYSKCDDIDGSRNNVINVLITCLLTSLRAFHPFMPFISENLYQHIKYKLCNNSDAFEFKSICEEPYPNIDAQNFMINFDKDVENEMVLVSAIIKKIRWFNFYFKADKNTILSDILIAINSVYLDSYKQYIISSTKISGLKIISTHDIYKYNHYYCFKVDSEDDERLNDYDVYILFEINLENTFKNLRESKIKPEILNLRIDELKQFQCNNFLKNFSNSKLREVTRNS